MKKFSALLFTVCIINAGALAQGVGFSPTDTQGSTIRIDNGLLLDTLNFLDGTSMTTAPLNFWSQNAGFLTYSGHSKIETSNLNAGGPSSISFEVDSSTALNFSTFYGSQIKFNFHANFTDYFHAIIAGSDEFRIKMDAPNFFSKFVIEENSAGKLFELQNSGRGYFTGSLAINNADFAASGYELDVNGGTKTDSLTTDKINFSDGTSLSSSLWQDNGTNISHRGRTFIETSDPHAGGTASVSFDSDSSIVSFAQYYGSQIKFNHYVSFNEYTHSINGVPDEFKILMESITSHSKFVVEDKTFGELFSITNGETGYLKGSLAIDTTYTPSGYKLAVNGDVIAEQVDVVLSQNWPDYVFEEDYDLLSIKETAIFIEENKHLPGMTSAIEMEEKGVVDLAEMNLKLLEKVEELTLHIIKLNENQEKLQIQNQHLTERIKNLESHE